MKDLILALKNNEKPFGLMSEAMQAKAKEIERTNFNYYHHSNEWICTVGSGDFSLDMTYRLRADYTEPVEDEYELVKIEPQKNFGGDLGYTKPLSESACLSAACDDPNFAGYLYEDGSVYNNSTVYKKSGCFGGEKTDMDRLNSRSVDVLRPTHVVFKKGVTT